MELGEKYQIARDTLITIGSMICWRDMAGDPSNMECNCFSCSARGALQAMEGEEFMLLHTSEEEEINDI